MRPWRYERPSKSTQRYTYGPDTRYQIRQLFVRSGQGRRCVWALYLGDQRIHEVHALSRVGFVMDDAMDYIKSARVAV